MLPQLLHTQGEMADILWTFVLRDRVCIYIQYIIHIYIYSHIYIYVESKTGYLGEPNPNFPGILQSVTTCHDMSPGQGPWLIGN